MTNERRDRIETFLKGLTYLYGVMDWEQFLKIANKHISPEVTEEEVKKERYFMFEKGAGYKIYEDIIQSTLAHDEIIDDVYNHAEEYHKEYYTPTEKQIVGRANFDRFYETTEAHKQLKKYLEKITSKEKAEKHMAKLHPLFAIDGVRKGRSISSRTEPLMEYIDKNGFLDCNNMEEINEVLSLFMNAMNNTRTWANRGRSPNQLGNQIRKNRERLYEILNSI